MASRTIPGAETPVSDELKREEHKLLAEQARFVMSQYTTMLAFYIAAAGLMLRELLASREALAMLAWVALASGLNALVLYGAWHFRSMARHVIDRQTLLADHLTMQRLHTLMWGYRAGVIGVLGVEALLVGYLAFSLL